MNESHSTESVNESRSHSTDESIDLTASPQLFDKNRTMDLVTSRPLHQLPLTFPCAGRPPTRGLSRGTIPPQWVTPPLRPVIHYISPRPSCGTQVTLQTFQEQTEKDFVTACDVKVQSVFRSASTFQLYKSKEPRAGGITLIIMLIKILLLLHFMLGFSHF